MSEREKEKGNMIDNLVGKEGPPQSTSVASQEPTQNQPKKTQ